MSERQEKENLIGSFSIVLAFVRCSVRVSFAAHQNSFFLFHSTKATKENRERNKPRVFASRERQVNRIFCFFHSFRFVIRFVLIINLPQWISFDEIKRSREWTLTDSLHSMYFGIFNWVSH